MFALPLYNILAVCIILIHVWLFYQSLEGARVKRPVTSGLKPLWQCKYTTLSTKAIYIRPAKISRFSHFVIGWIQYIVP